MTQFEVLEQVERLIADALHCCNAVLDLGSNQLTTLPSSLFALTSLEGLNLSYNQLPTLPSLISALTNLQWLELNFNQLTTLPSSTTALTNLQRLYLYSNQLTTLPSSISALTNLQRLYLWSNQLTTLPSSISTLTNLQLLNLWSNPLATLPSSISALANLQQLYLRSNQLTTLPSSISTLTNLKLLDLGENKLTTLPSSISTLTNLQGLYLRSNQLKTLPSSLVALVNLTKLKIEDNPLKSPPLAVAKKGLLAIQDFYDKAFEKIQVPQKKIVIVGEGLVGKTSLVKRLKNVRFYSLQGSSRTEGVDIHNIEISKGKFVSVWDFAGQEHFLSSHKLYFTKNSVFVIVVQLIDSYQQISDQLAKWMFIVHQLCPESKVVVIATKLDLVKKNELKEKVMQIDHAITTLQSELPLNLQLNPNDALSPKLFVISNDNMKNIPSIVDLLKVLAKESIASSVIGSAGMLKLLNDSKEMCMTVKPLALQSNLSIQHCIEVLHSLEELGMIVYLESNEQDEDATVILNGDLISKAFNQLKVKSKSLNTTSITGWIDYNLAKSVLSNDIKFKLFIEVVEQAKLIYIERKGEVKDWKIFVPQIGLNHNTTPLYQKETFHYSVGRIYHFKCMLPIGFFEHLTIQMQFFAKITLCNILISSCGIKLFGNSEAVYIQKIKLGSQFDSAVQLLSQSSKGALTLLPQVLEAFEECLFSYLAHEQTVTKFVKRLAICPCTCCQQKFRDNNLTIDQYLPFMPSDQISPNSTPLLTLFIRNKRFAGCAESDASVPITDLLPEVAFFNLPLIQFTHIKLNKFNIRGKGAFGTVTTGTLPNGQQVAVKEIKDIQAAFKEINILRMLDHPCILKIIGYSRSELNNTAHMYIITELLDKSLSQLVHEFKGSLSTDLIFLLPIAVSIAEGIAHLHSRNPPIIHRDIKPDNIMLDKEMKVKIIDFGIAKLSTLPYLYERQGTPGYCAPEVMGQTQYNSAVDIYSFGRVLMKMCGDMGHLKQHNELSPLIEQLHTFITKCADKEPLHRPTAFQCVDQLKNMLERATLLKRHHAHLFENIGQAKELSKTKQHYSPVKDLPTQTLTWTSAKQQLATNAFANKDELKAQLKTLQLEIRDNPGNGDCLPFSLIDYLKVTTDFNGDCSSLRQIIANYVRANWQHLSKTYPDTIGPLLNTEENAREWAAKYQRPQQWCETEFASICAVFFKVRVEIFVMTAHHSLERIVFEPVNMDYLPTIRLAYVNNNHYVSVWPVDDDE